MAKLQRRKPWGRGMAEPQRKPWGRGVAKPQRRKPWGRGVAEPQRKPWGGAWPSLREGNHGGGAWPSLRGNHWDMAKPQGRKLNHGEGHGQASEEETMGRCVAKPQRRKPWGGAWPTSEKETMGEGCGQASEEESWRDVAKFHKGVVKFHKRKPWWRRMVETYKETKGEGCRNNEGEMWPPFNYRHQEIQGYTPFQSAHASACQTWA